MGKRPKIYLYKSTKKVKERSKTGWPSFRLMWPLSIYKEWHIYEKLACKTKCETFEDWFDIRKYAEPLQDDDVKVIKQKDNKLVIEFDLAHDLQRLGLNFLKVASKYKAEYTYKSLAKVQPSKNIKNFTLKTSRQRRQVYYLKQKGIKNLEIAKKLKLITDDVYNWKILMQGVNRHKPDKNLVEKLVKLETRIVKSNKGKSPDTIYNNAERTILRNKNECKETLKNVKKGVFP